ncbi:CHAD domain-containing protein [Caballeronia sp. LjRoot34]|uniref:CHAD domain-containing protein n=1 Tax=Caballeronia sp. LjRoot34 TaxID=3342325 RepID=UPI003ECFF235
MAFEIGERCRSTARTSFRSESGKDRQRPSGSKPKCALGSCQAQLAALALRPALPVFARSRIDLVVRAVRKHTARALRRSHHTDASLHAVRIEITKLRYLLEFFSPLLTKVPGGDPKWLSMIQEWLGALNDVVVSKTLVQRHANVLDSRKTLRKALRRLKKHENG